MKTLAIVVLVLLFGLALFIRYQAPDPEVAHVDPKDARFPSQSGVRLLGDDAVRFNAAPHEVLSAVLQIATSNPNTQLLSGSPESGMITFVTRSRVFGFQDYTTAKATADAGVTTLTIAARTRIPNGSDWGVNRKRLENWLGELVTRLPEAGR